MHRTLVSSTLGLSVQLLELHVEQSNIDISTWYNLMFLSVWYTTIPFDLVHLIIDSIHFCV